MVTASITLESGDFQMNAKVTIPAGPMRTSDLLPIVRSISEAVCGQTVQAVEAAGESISCKAGCGACCRHLVAISEVEARRMAAMVETLPEPRRQHVLDRYAAAIAQLESSGVLNDVRRMRQMTDDEYDDLCQRYFAARVACPFLEDESCSIHPERPITCREYLVTNPPEICAELHPVGLRRVRVLLPIFNAFARVQTAASKNMSERWVPLVLALEWSKQNTTLPPSKPGPELLREFLDCVRQVDEETAPGGA